MARDSDLVLRVQRGDAEAFADLARGIGPRLLGVAYSILRDRPLAEDASQQALVRIWRKVPRLRDPSRFDAWSYRIVVRECYAQAKRQRHWSSVDDLPADREPVATDPYHRIADRDELERGFRRLSMDHRAVLVLHHFLDLTLDETAAVLGIPVGTVRSRLYYATQGLRAALAADGRTDGHALAPSGGITR
jgi:RNA polymerase sigma-70 factor (ECF subfamily)